MQSIDVALTNLIISNWFNVAMAVIAIISLIYAVFSYRIKKPYWDKKSLNVINENSINRFNKLKLSYDSNEIKNLTITNVLFLNKGREPIRDTDIDIPLSVHIADGYKILDTKIIYPKDIGRYELETAPDGSYVNLRFKYMEQNEGSVIQVIHNSKTGRDVFIEGKIIGVKKMGRFFSPMQSGPNVSKLTIKRTRQLYDGILTLIAIALVGVAVRTYFIPSEAIPGIITIIFYALMEVWIYSNRIPNGLEIFEVLKEEI